MALPHFFLTGQSDWLNPCTWYHYIIIDLTALHNGHGTLQLTLSVSMTLVKLISAMTVSCDDIVAHQVGQGLLFICTQL